jgi:outer membrane protein insertion porin family
MSMTFNIAEAPRVYVERIDVNGNTLTQDKVVRREFRMPRATRSTRFQVKRSTDRINSLGFFQEKLEIEQKPGSAPDRIVLEANVEEKPTGELQLSAGFSSLEKFIFQASRSASATSAARAELSACRASAIPNIPRASRLSFTEPYLFDRNVALGVDIYRRDYNSFNYFNNDRNTTYQAGDDRLPAARRRAADRISGRWRLALQPQLSMTSRSTLRPTHGRTFTFSQDFAGLGGSVKYLRSRVDAGQWIPITGSFVLSLKAEAGYILGLGKQSSDPTVDKVRLTDRFFLGEPQLRGFDIRGVGPRVIREYGSYSATGFTSSGQKADDALGGRLYYLGHAEIEIPLGAGAREMGLRPSIFMDVGAVGKIRKPTITPQFGGYCQAVSGTISTNSQGQQVKTPNPNAAPVNTPATNFIGQCPTNTVNGSNYTDYTYLGNAFQETYVGNSLSPRLSVGFGVNWNSPFGPFRIDIAKALLKQKGDDTKLITFNIGTQF